MTSAVLVLALSLSGQSPQAYPAAQAPARSPRLPRLRPRSPRLLRPDQDRPGASGSVEGGPGSSGSDARSPRLLRLRRRSPRLPRLRRRWPRLLRPGCSLAPSKVAPAPYAPSKIAPAPQAAAPYARRRSPRLPTLRRRLPRLLRRLLPTLRRRWPRLLTAAPYAPSKIAPAPQAAAPYAPSKVAPAPQAAAPYAPSKVAPAPQAAAPYAPAKIAPAPQAPAKCPGSSVRQGCSGSSSGCSLCSGQGRSPILSKSFSTSRAWSFALIPRDQAQFVLTTDSQATCLIPGHVAFAFAAFGPTSTGQEGDGGTRGRTRLEVAQSTSRWGRSTGSIRGSAPPTGSSRYFVPPRRRGSSGSLAVLENAS